MALGILVWIGLNVFFVSVASFLVVYYAGVYFTQFLFRFQFFLASSIWKWNPADQMFSQRYYDSGRCSTENANCKSNWSCVFCCWWTQYWKGKTSCGTSILNFLQEGPMIHSGAVVAAGISQGRAVSLPIDLGVRKVLPVKF